MNRVEPPVSRWLIPAGSIAVLLVVGAVAAGAAVPDPANQSAPSNLAQVANVAVTGSNTLAIGKVALNKVERTISFPAEVIPPSAYMRDQIIEYAVVTQAGKTYEALFATSVEPKDVHVAALLLGVSPGPIPILPNQAVPLPPSAGVEVEVSWTQDGKTVQHPLSEFVLMGDRNPGPNVPRLAAGPWLYNGSRVLEDGAFVAQQGGSIVSLIFDPDALINNPRPDKDDQNIHFPNTALLPKGGTPVTITLKLPAKPTPAIEAPKQPAPGGSGPAAAPSPKRAPDQ